MKNIFYLVVILSIISCQKPKHNYVTLSGNISHLKVDTISIYGNNRFKRQITINKDGSFKDTLTVKDGFFAFANGKSQAFVNLKKGYEIKVKADANDFENTISFTGDGASTNNYLVKKINKQKKFGLANLESIFLMDKTSFDKKVTEIDDFNKKILSESKGLDSSFVANEKTANARMLTFLNKNYPAQHLKLTKFAKGKPSPSFNLENYKGGKTSLESLKGKYVYIDVWATWCAPCRKQIPALKKVEKQYEGKNIAFISLSIDKKSDKVKCLLPYSIH